MKTALFIYDTAQITGLSEFLSTNKTLGESVVIACSANIEFLLEKEGVPFRSARHFLTMHPYERLRHSHELSVSILHAPEFAFFSHRNISFGHLFTQGLFVYLTSFLYYFDMVISALESDDYGQVVLYMPTLVRGSEFGGNLSVLMSQIVPDVVRIVCERQAKKLTIISESQHLHVGAIFKERVFKIKRTLFGYGIGMLNLWVKTFIPKKDIRILGSELWKNIGPLMQGVPEGELILFDRAESLSIGLKNIFKHRMRFVHSADFVTRAMQRTATERYVQYESSWKSSLLRNKGLQEATFRSYSLVPILEMVLNQFLSASEKLVRDIEGTEAMLKGLRPDIIIVRASASAQTHFAVLCEVARLLGIPSLEIQHGIFSVGPETETSDRSAEYIAEYGPHEREIWQKHHYAVRSKFIDVGSPRFDPYIIKGVTQKPLSDNTFKILHIALPLVPGSWNDSWDIVDYFATMAFAAKDIPNVHVTIKLRSTRANEAFYRESIARAFGAIPYSVKIFESLADLLPLADVVVTCHSTAVLEALMSHRPVILDASLPVYTQLARNDFSVHREAGALLVAETPDILKSEVVRLARDAGERERLSECAKKFMHENYLFEDGKSSERLAEVIRRLAKNRELK